MLLKEVDNLIVHFSFYFRLATLPFVKKNNAFCCGYFILYPGYAEGKRRRAFKSLEKGKEIKGEITVISITEIMYAACFYSVYTMY